MAPAVTLMVAALVVALVVVAGTECEEEFTRHVAKGPRDGGGWSDGGSNNTRTLWRRATALFFLFVIPIRIVIVASGRGAIGMVEEGAVNLRLAVSVTEGSG